MRRTRRTVPRAGLTLVELLVAALVLAVALVALAGTAAALARAAGGSGATAAAVHAARSALERARAEPCDSAGVAAGRQEVEATAPVAARPGVPASSLAIRTAFPCPR